MFDPHEHLVAISTAMRAVFEGDPSQPGWRREAMRLALLIDERPMNDQLEAAEIRRELRARLVRAGFIA